ncbi:MAG: energy coupling factor transporter S component ThiW [Candidatus Caldatribacterium sp.]|uniref:energy coupling factor transporter S component ThiW n=1 Tax=Candidatus Caldatribacterium sp. TaxID=2282143 RepID=UPI00299A216D|nr:energy coupling factor transporter S component ThiW [Candidatus Caldatribacterium sp.]MCX7729679.1 energy coupling factor transporter S component ThiW [Candidatus Caldatribacterium sp.]MDW8080409.1 energy coupling factor transporter S component ThiW [Candidatus Calescibacterium sp.]
MRRLLYAGLFAALAVVASGFHVPVGPTKIFPFQHTINVLAGIAIGPWYGALAAAVAGTIRILLGTGTVFAFPGGIPGVICVGLMYRLLRKDFAGFFEPLGTGVVGAALSAYIVAPLVGREATLLFFQTAFLMSSVPGSVLGVLLVKAIRRVRHGEFLLGKECPKC